MATASPSRTAAQGTAVRGAVILLVLLLATQSMAPAAVADTGVHPSDDAIALTFDDGPDPEWTPVVLDILDRYRVKATFFVVGWKVARNPDLARDIVARGHSIQVHTYYHASLVALGPDSLRRAIQKGRNVITRVTGATPTCLRPPFGFYNGRVLAAMEKADLDLAMWDVDARDYYYHSAERTLEIVTSATDAGDVVIMHDTWGSIYQTALPRIIEFFQDQGIGFDTICDVFVPRPPPVQIRKLWRV